MQKFHVKYHHSGSSFFNFNSVALKNFFILLQFQVIIAILVPLNHFLLLTLKDFFTKELVPSETRALNFQD
jgi:hypothetical protein